MPRFSSNIFLFKSKATLDKDALLERIIDEHTLPLRLFLKVRLSQQSDREDIEQEVFLRLIRIPNMVEHLSQQPDTIRHYIFTIASNLIRDRIRRSAVRQHNQHDSYNEDSLYNDSPGPETILLHDRQYQQIKHAVEKLPKKYRTAFLLSRFGASSYREISEHMNVSVSTVEKYISAALVALRKELR